jgi:hypothetical protein
MGQICRRHRNIRNAYKIVLIIPDDRIPYGTPEDRWNNIIKIYFEEIFCKRLNLI